MAEQARRHCAACGKSLRSSTSSTGALCPSCAPLSRRARSWEEKLRDVGRHVHISDHPSRDMHVPGK